MTSSTPMATYNISSLGRLQMAHQDVGVHSGAGIHRLVVPTVMSASWLSNDTDVAFVLVAGAVYLAQPTYRFVGELNTQVADARAFPNSIDLAVALTDEQLAGIEQARGHGDVSLNLKNGSGRSLHDVAKAFEPARLTQARVLAELTKAELADAVHVSAAAVGQYEAGVNTPRPDLLPVFARALKVPVEFFATGRPLGRLDAAEAHFRSLR